MSAYRVLSFHNENEQWLDFSRDIPHLHYCKCGIFLFFDSDFYFRESGNVDKFECFNMLWCLCVNSTKLAQFFSTLIVFNFVDGGVDNNKTSVDNSVFYHSLNASLSRSGKKPRLKCDCAKQVCLPKWNFI